MIQDLGSYYQTLDVEYEDPVYGYTVCEVIYKVTPPDPNGESDWDYTGTVGIEEVTVFLNKQPVNFIDVPNNYLYQEFKKYIRSSDIASCM